MDRGSWLGRRHQQLLEYYRELKNPPSLSAAL
ncbi:hypothetical protein FOQG_05618 [Fusarium oxysporum f. sp. raphani 54005]|uniref:Uncharacterized protein n=7 Tax=Fusarium oxysporum TaxID=5507 RepID=X0CNR8_FUSOX|nr:hypothetical protein FOXG_19803 [Fusarium oxysporum f. sp. lycopersici 4287]EWZ41693.1 hypothetical protein FOZG_06895 [Fusarium oxysporum Fo47]EXA01210.1 hypothetical protein FOWG_01151 [Fusarium oxysporum f. sp. lycopersici MN25]EXA48044.1 hypothetical protein FOVG_04931 [Fusarium oxysporum f. sp. pisi HDV247]EXK31890.1 hypothetical protein FOMG_12285 [Fusarium oxysporum f. sp. melonis 26406]EXK92489.1 hypothetical protein FOQG_05618 [Fusarium oxysporum f. sp. raphani 54005]EXL59890.1 hy